MRVETLLELEPRDILARRRRCGEGGIFVDPAPMVQQARIARRQPFTLIAAPRALECLTDRRAHARDRGLECFIIDSFIGYVGVVLGRQRRRHAVETHFLRSILAGRDQLVHVVGELVALPARPGIPM